MNKNNIAFCINSLSFGGAEKVVLTIIENISKDFPVELICLEKTFEYTVRKNIKVTFLSQKRGSEGGITVGMCVWVCEGVISHVRRKGRR